MKYSLAHKTSRLVIALTFVGLTACGSDSPKTQELTLLAYESFTPPAGAFDAFTDQTGIKVTIALSGDAGEMVAKASLTAGNPEGDVMWGVDNTFISRATDSEVFDGEPVAVDYGDVCVNYDIAALAERGIDAPQTLDDLLFSQYASMLVIENATTSSPGLAFLLATIAAFGDDWPNYWEKLIDNDVLIVDSWSDAYYTSFTRYGGDRPLVVSYATSPPAEVIFADPPMAQDAPAPTGVATETCFRQTEYAGILSGTNYPAESQLLIDYLISKDFQTLLPESLFVYPINADVELPESFIKYAPLISQPFTLASEDIATYREVWLEQWSDIALR